MCSGLLPTPQSSKAVKKLNKLNDFFHIYSFVPWHSNPKASVDKVLGFNSFKKEQICTTEQLLSDFLRKVLADL